MPTMSASSPTFSQRLSNTALWIFFTISGVVTSFGRHCDARRGSSYGIVLTLLPNILLFHIKIMFDPSSFANPTPLAHADTSRDVFPRGAESVRGHSYLDMIQNWLMPQLEEFSQDFIFQHDGSPPSHNDTIPIVKFQSIRATNKVLSHQVLSTNDNHACHPTSGVFPANFGGLRSNYPDYASLPHPPN
ncbi:hypothetical protein TNCV_4050191 [Trichonephila clavipes]|nr:hypothetical protein TNCV_4050191 [Trichonephila clavipes]